MIRKAASNMSLKGGVNDLLERRYRRLSMRCGGGSSRFRNGSLKSELLFLAVMMLNFYL